MSPARLLLLSLASASVLSLAAETPDSTNMPQIVREISSGTVEVTLPAGFVDRLTTNTSESETTETPATNSTKPTSRSGYRVQVFDDNNARTAKHEAQSRRSQISARFPEFRTYISFNSPYWRVKVGDFRTRSEAEAAMGAIRSAFPGMSSQLRIVRDRINP